MVPPRRAVQRCLFAGLAGLAFLLLPLAAAADGQDVDALWNQPQGTRPDSALYPLQSWWDGLNKTVSDDPTQRGLDELAQANTDLLIAYTMLQEQHSNPGPHPVAIIDPLLSTVYNTVTGSNVKAPVGAIFNWINSSLVGLQGRGSTNDMVRRLLQDYRMKQAVAVHDLQQRGGADIDALVSANTQRETAFLSKIKAVSRPDDGLKTLLDEADHSTVALANRHHADPGQGKALGHDRDKGGASKGGNANQPSKK